MSLGGRTECDFLVATALNLESIKLTNEREAQFEGI